MCHKNKRCVILSKWFKLCDKIMKICDKKIKSKWARSVSQEQRMSHFVKMVQIIWNIWQNYENTRLRFDFYQSVPDIIHKNRMCLILSKWFKLCDKITKTCDKKVWFIKISQICDTEQKVCHSVTIVYIMWQNYENTW